MRVKSRLVETLTELCTLKPNHEEQPSRSRLFLFFLTLLQLCLRCNFVSYFVRWES